MMHNPGAQAASVGPTDQSENIKDTIESLVIAFILAFVFRGFLVEAFVIPTGSMAPTLYGKHGTQICPDCGWEYAYGLPDGRSEREEIKCPNCAWESASHEDIPYHGPGCKHRARWSNPNYQFMNPLVAEKIENLSYEPRSGDRILVFKWPFDLGGPLLGPQPWDVVVFKNPLNGEDNYIKRLIGVPNEVLEIIDGDVYACPLSRLDPETVSQLERAISLKHQQLQPGSSNNGRGRQLSILQSRIAESLNDKLVIRRKTSVAQKSLWHIVFDQDYRPAGGVSADRPHWEADLPAGVDNHWDTSRAMITFDGQHVARQAIRFAGERIEDFYAYNFDRGQGRRGYDAVGDLRMRFVLQYEGGDGLFGLLLSKRNDVFTAEFSPSGEIRVNRSSLDGSTTPELMTAARIEPWKQGRPIQIEFGIVDYRVYIKIDNEEEPVCETTDEYYAPQIAGLRENNGRPNTKPSQARIYADHLDFTIAHLLLERDVYYKNSYRRNQPGWGTMGNPIFLREGEYFVLGDNSPASQDSRMWDLPGEYLLRRGEDYQVGTVPADQMIGKAFFVYWPSGYRIKWLPVLKDFGAIPNVGKMRWIR